MITIPQIYKLYDPVVIDKDYGSGAFKISTQNLQAWANQIGDCIDATNTNQQSHAQRIAKLEDSVSKLEDLFDFIKGAHPEVLKEYAMNRAASKRMTK